MNIKYKLGISDIFMTLEIQFVNYTACYVTKTRLVN